MADPFSQFLSDATAHRDEQIARRAAAGVTPSTGIIDWNGIMYDAGLSHPTAAPASAIAPSTTNGLTPEQSAWLAKVGDPQKFSMTTDAERNALAAVAQPQYVKRVGEGSGEVLNKTTDRLPKEVYATAGIDKSPTNLPMPTLGIDQALTAAHTAEKQDKAIGKTPNLWTSIVDGASGIASHSLLGMAVKGLFPDQWNGVESALKNFDIGKPVDTGPGWFEQVTDPMYNPGSSESGTARGETVYGAMPEQKTSRRKPGAPEPMTPTGTTTSGGTPTTGDTRAPRSVSFPDMPPYKPGRDNEWTYFSNNHLAQGGIVGYADGGPVTPPTNMLDGSDPRVALIAETEDVLAEVTQGKKPDEHDAKVLKKFVATFGDTALKQLHDSVAGGTTMRGSGRLVRGAGGPQEDAIPALINGVQPAALSDGEFVFPADAVAAAGEGDHAAGAQKLQELSNMLQGGAPGQPLNVEQVQ